LQVEVLVSMNEGVEDEFADAFGLRVDTDARVEIVGAAFDDDDDGVGVGLAGASAEREQ
jgi:hypothetical protein